MFLSLLDYFFDRKSLVLLGLLFAIFGFALFLNVYTPVHSDDFRYGLPATNLWKHVEREFHQYMTQGGRSLVHLTARIVLQAHPIVQDFINAAALTTLMVFAAMLAFPFGRNKNFGLAIYIAFVLYFFRHPELGQTSLWIVGSANYLWPLLGLNLQILLFERGYTRNGNLMTGLTFLLGLANGWSTEILSIAVIIYSLLYCFLNKRLSPPLVGAIMGNVVGSLFLFLAPGNYHRLDRNNFSQYREMSFVEKFLDSILVDMPRFLFATSHLFLLIVVLVFISRDRRLSLQKILPFVIAMLAGMGALGMAPYAATRALNAPLFFGLLATMVLIPQIDLNSHKKVIYGLGIVLSLMLFREIFFITQGYIRIDKQSDIRIALIEQAKERNEKQVTIPDWYTDGVIQTRHMYDTFRSPAISRYYGVKVRVVNLNQDYGKLGLDEVSAMMENK